jgi:hypothetical protein
MRLRATTKIAAFLEKHHLQGVTPHDTPMTPAIAASMSRANCPEGLSEIQAMDNKRSAYMTYVGFFCYATNTVFVHCRNTDRLMSKFLQNPGSLHWEAILHAIGFLSANQNEFLEYRRSVNFDGIFYLFTMVADL